MHIISLGESGLCARVCTRAGGRVTRLIEAPVRPRPRLDRPSVSCDRGLSVTYAIAADGAYGVDLSSEVIQYQFFGQCSCI